MRSKRTVLKKCVAIKADRNTLQRIITAYDDGRRVDLPQILSHGLMAVLLATFDASSQLCTGRSWIALEIFQD